MIKNLSQLKKALTVGTRFAIVEHCKAEMVGQVRKVNYADTTGFYSIIPDAPDSKFSTVNRGRGSFFGWSNAPFWEFRENGICAVYTSNTKKTAEHLVIAIRVLE